MPIIPSSSYPGPPVYQINGHWQTIAPAIFRSIRGLRYERERFILSDGDFVDLDWVDKRSRRLVVLSHGLEGNTERHYMKGMARIFAEAGYDILAWNCRSCSGEMNHNLRLYNHGEIGDIGEVIDHALRTKDYEEVVLIGFSMGGNITLKYLGVNSQDLSPAIRAGVAFSAPCDLHSSVALLNEPQSRFYRNRFLKMLRKKMIIKAQQFPEIVDLENFSRIKEWSDFDNYFTAPINGYQNAQDFYDQGSAANFMADINVPTLLVNALNDPILTPACSPQAMCAEHDFIHLETPATGGHVGFALARSRHAWSELRAREFVKSLDN